MSVLKKSVGVLLSTLMKCNEATLSSWLHVADLKFCCQRERREQRQINQWTIVVVNNNNTEGTQGVQSWRDLGEGRNEEAYLWLMPYLG